jgi:tRNA threonylcarbamoyladenosine biosynthesis protein TsaB
MSRILSVDTSTQACSVALSINGQIQERYEVKPQQHTQLVLAMIEDLLAEAELKLAQLDALAFGCGPGSFTGLRIVAGVVQGIAFAADLPVIPISTLQALAQTAYRIRGWTHVITALDARMHELYWAGFQLNGENLMQTVLAEQLCHIADLPLLADDNWYGVGDGWLALANSQIMGLVEIDAAILPHAQDIAVLGAVAFRQGKMVNAEQALPVYLRDNMYKPKA